MQRLSREREAEGQKPGEGKATGRVCQEGKRDQKYKLLMEESCRTGAEIVLWN